MQYFLKESKLYVKNLNIFQNNKKYVGSDRALLGQDVTVFTYFCTGQAGPGPRKSCPCRPLGQAIKNNSMKKLICM